MNYAAYVGRVGALAVALGVGAAIAGSTGVAWADDSSSGSSSGSSSKSSTAGPSKDSGSDTGRSSKSQREPRSTASGKSDDSGSTGKDNTKPDRTNTPKADSDTDQDDKQDDEDDRKGNADKKADRSGGLTKGADKFAEAGEIDATPTGGEVTSSGAAQGEDAPKVEQPAADTDPNPVAAVGDAEVKAPSVADTASDDADLAAAPAVIQKVSLASNPTVGMPSLFGPVNLPNGLGQLGFLALLETWRRQIEGAFRNQRPTVAPSGEVTMGDGGKLSGSLGATDPDGDPLRYQMERLAAHGQVTVDANGIVTYVPDDPNFVGTDTFTLSVRDKGFRLFSQPGVTTVIMTVQLGETPTMTATEIRGGLGAGSVDLRGPLTREEAREVLRDPRYVNEIARLTSMSPTQIRAAADDPRVIDAMVEASRNPQGREAFGTGSNGSYNRPNGEAGGWLAGNGGNGFDAAGYAGKNGGNGGDGGIFGSGGNGGSGGLYGHGGRGGSAVFYGNGGSGGRGGNGAAGNPGRNGGIGIWGGTQSTRYGGRNANVTGYHGNPGKQGYTGYTGQMGGKAGNGGAGGTGGQNFGNGGNGGTGGDGGRGGNGGVGGQGGTGGNGGNAVSRHDPKVHTTARGGTGGQGGRGGTGGNGGQGGDGGAGGAGGRAP
ncbi:MAG: Ig-like domain-containing protein, partial [Mycobacterium sp.]